MRHTLHARLFVAVVAAVVSLSTTGADAQWAYDRGQNAVPVFEGWEPNPDGSFNLVFGYMNRNLDEHLAIPVGPDNQLEPGGPDQGPRLG